MPKIIQRRVRVLSNVHLTNNYYKLALNLPEMNRIVRPGQFVMLRINQDYKPFLRRPFSIHRIVYNSKLSTHRQRKSLKGKAIEVLYKIVGKGTEMLSLKKTGEYLDVLGPLGNGFSILDSRCSLLVGGGIGIAPLLFLAEHLSAVSRQRLVVFIGARTKKEILCKKEFADLSLDVKICTDDGSVGFPGKVTDLLKHSLLTEGFGPLRIYACGPKPMLREISTISKKYNIPAQISLDEYMACGLGVCLGCMVKTSRGYKSVCKEGPVFDSAKIRWSAFAK